MPPQVNHYTEPDTLSDLHHELLQALANRFGPEVCRTDRASRTVYARDASHLSLGLPLAVVLPRDRDEVAAAVRLCAQYGVPFVGRGSGTGLSGGAVPGDREVVISCRRLGELGRVDPDQRQVRVGAGVLNESVSSHAGAHDLHFAPDPSSQSAATIGGNIAENAGGPHCLKVGTTLQHLLRLTWLDAQGHFCTTGRGLGCERGIGLLGLLTGCEGTLGLVTDADLKLTLNPTAETTLLAMFDRLEDATAAVIDLLGAGLTPVAVEIVDQAVLGFVEQAFGFGFPTDAEAAMIVEFAGTLEAVSEDFERAQPILTNKGAREVRQAVDQQERLALWNCRKKAFGAVGRVTPCYVTMDVVVPLGRLSDLVHAIGKIKQQFGLEIATAFHAGDGNLHPGVLYDDRDVDHTQRAHAAAERIITTALELGGSVTGEHGVGIEKIHALCQQLDPTAARLMHGIKALFDPRQLCNPGKSLPPVGAVSTGGRPAPDTVHFQWDSLTVTAPAQTGFEQIQASALKRGFWVPLGLPLTTAGVTTAGTTGDVVANLLPGPTALGTGTTREYLLEMWAETGDGQPFHAGAPVFKNVAGYDLPHLLCGSGQMLVRQRGATFQLKPVPECVRWWRLRAATLDPDALMQLLAELAAWDPARSGAK